MGPFLAGLEGGFWMLEGVMNRKLGGARLEDLYSNRRSSALTQFKVDHMKQHIHQLRLFFEKEPRRRKSHWMSVCPILECNFQRLESVSNVRLGGAMSEDSYFERIQLNPNAEVNHAEENMSRSCIVFDIRAKEARGSSEAMYTILQCNLWNIRKCDDEYEPSSRKIREFIILAAPDLTPIRTYWRQSHAERHSLVSSAF
jgi:hypothetical protein